MDEHIDQQIIDLFSTNSETYTGLTWEKMRTKITDPDSDISCRLQRLQMSGKLRPITIYVLEVEHEI